jgi:hypothetical protein
MTAALDREKLASVLGMLGSSHDGEVLSAARQAERLRRGAGLTWPDILLPAAPAPDAPGEIAEFIRYALGRADMLSAWERQFLVGVRQQTFPATPKQHNILRRIQAKLQRSAEARAP